ncbi:MAG: hypothetical protein U1E38_07310 [Rhodospirillales bacterium]
MGVSHTFARIFAPLRYGVLAVAAVVLASPAAWAEGARVDTGLPLSMGAASQGSGTAGTVPNTPGQTLVPDTATGQRGVQLRSNLLDGKTLQAGPTFDYRPNAPHPEVPQISANRDSLNNPVEVGGFIGYLFHDDASGLPPSSLGFNLQAATDSRGSTSGWLLQPGLDCSTALAPSWQLSTRLFSTYSPDSSSVSALGVERSSSLRPSEPGSRTWASASGSAIRSPTAGTSRRRRATSGCWVRASPKARASPRRTNSSAA